MSGLSTGFGQAGNQAGLTLRFSSSSRSELSRHQKALQCVTLVNNKHSVITLSCCCYRPPLAAVPEEIVSPFVPLSSAVLSLCTSLAAAVVRVWEQVLLRLVQRGSPEPQGTELGTPARAAPLCSPAIQPGTQQFSWSFFCMFARFLEEVEKSELSPSLLVYAELCVSEDEENSAPDFIVSWFPMNFQ